MAQQTCYADSPDMPVPFAGKDLTGMNAEVRYIRLAQHTESREQDMV